jgi:ATP-dependent protease Clp ATPase subunit
MSAPPNLLLFDHDDGDDDDENWDEQPSGRDRQPEVAQKDSRKDHQEKENASGDDHGDAAVAVHTYHHILAGLRARVTGHDAALEQLALAFDHRWAGAQGASVRERVLLIGPSGTGKSHILRALAEVLAIPCVVVDASSLSESGWQGLQPADVMARVYDAVDRDIARIERGGAMIILDEADKLTPGRLDGDAQIRSVREGRQQSLLSILGGLTPVRFTIEEQQQLDRRVLSLAARTDRMPIICAGAFPDLRFHGSAPTDQDLRDYGMIPELASRLSSRIVLAQRTPAELVAMWRSEVGLVAQLTASAAAVGYELVITEGATAVAAHAVHSATAGMTTRGGAAMISAAVRRALIAALAAGASGSQRIVIAPDDVCVSRRRSHER